MEAKDINIGMKVRAVASRMKDSPSLAVRLVMWEAAASAETMEVQKVEMDDKSLNVYVSCAHPSFTATYDSAYWFLAEWLEPALSEALQETPKEEPTEEPKKETQLYYVASKAGFLCFYKDRWYEYSDVRHAYVFNSWLEADTQAKQIPWIKRSYYAILGTCQ